MDNDDDRIDHSGLDRTIKPLQTLRLDDGWIGALWMPQYVPKLAEPLAVRVWVAQIAAITQELIQTYGHLGSPFHTDRLERDEDEEEAACSDSEIVNDGEVGEIAKLFDVPNREVVTVGDMRRLQASRQLCQADAETCASVGLMCAHLVRLERIAPAAWDKFTEARINLGRAEGRPLLTKWGECYGDSLHRIVLRQAIYVLTGFVGQIDDYVNEGVLMEGRVGSVEAWRQLILCNPEALDHFRECNKVDAMKWHPRLNLERVEAERLCGVPLTAEALDKYGAGIEFKTGLGPAKQQRRKRKPRSSRTKKILACFGRNMIDLWAIAREVGNDCEPNDVSQTFRRWKADLPADFVARYEGRLEEAT